MPYCKECGRELDPDAKFCPHCGTRISVIALRAPKEPKAPEKPKAQPETPQNIERAVTSIIAAVAIAVVIVVFLMAVVSEPKGWLNGWSYRKPITIEGSGAALENYQVKVLVIFDNNMLENFDDLRFVGDDQVTELSYWIEHYSPGESATVWVKVPNIPENGEIIYMYYGNPGASSASIGVTTFEFFDDFDFYDNDKWDNSGTTGIYSIENGTLKGVNGSYLTPLKARIFSAPDTYVIEGRLMNKTNGGLNVLARWQSSDNLLYGEMNDFWDKMYISLRENATWVIDKAGPAFSYDTWYDFSFKEYPHFSYEWKLDNLFVSATGVLGSAGYFALSATTANPSYFDNIRVRKYISPEPEVSVEA